MLPSHIVITGASSGLGAALALEYAGNGVVFGLLGRHAGRLETVAAQCRQRGAVVETATIDVTDSAAMQEWLQSFDIRYPVELCIANAGISAGSGGGGESLDQALRLFGTNINGVLNTIHPLIDLMVARRKGQIALVSSIAGFRGLPTAPAYSASKATIRYYGQALRGLLYNKGVQVSVICPGFIKTPMTDVNPFPMPFMVAADKAARIIRTRLAFGHKLIAFPWPLVWMSRVQNLLPDAIMNRIYARLPGKPAE